MARGYGLSAGGGAGNAVGGGTLGFLLRQAGEDDRGILVQHRNMDFSWHMQGEKREVADPEVRAKIEFPNAAEDAKVVLTLPGTDRWERVPPERANGRVRAFPIIADGHADATLQGTGGPGVSRASRMRIKSPTQGITGNNGQIEVFHRPATASSRTAFGFLVLGDPPPELKPGEVGTQRGAPRIEIRGTSVGNDYNGAQIHALYNSGVALNSVHVATTADRVPYSPFYININGVVSVGDIANAINAYRTSRGVKPWFAIVRESGDVEFNSRTTTKSVTLAGGTTATPTSLTVAWDADSQTLELEVDEDDTFTDIKAAIAALNEFTEDDITFEQSAVGSDTLANLPAEGETRVTTFTGGHTVPLFALFDTTFSVNYYFNPGVTTLQEIHDALTGVGWSHTIGTYSARSGSITAADVTIDTSGGGAATDAVKTSGRGALIFTAAGGINAVPSGPIEAEARPDDDTDGPNVLVRYDPALDDIEACLEGFRANNNGGFTFTQVYGTPLDAAPEAVPFKRGMDISGGEAPSVGTGGLTQGQVDARVSLLTKGYALKGGPVVPDAEIDGDITRDSELAEEVAKFPTRAQMHQGILEQSVGDDNAVMDTLWNAERLESFITEGAKYYVSAPGATTLEGKILRRTSRALPGNLIAFRASFATYWETIAGLDGAQGPAGPAGKQGVQGERGPAGRDGNAGPRGPKGDQGDRGLPGPSGTAGPAGPRGPKGDTGDTGPRGPQGPKGDKGDPGTGGTGGTTDATARSAAAAAQATADTNEAKIAGLQGAVQDVIVGDIVDHNWQDVNKDGSEGGVGENHDTTNAAARGATYSAPSFSDGDTDNFILVRIPRNSDIRHYQITISGVEGAIGANLLLALGHSADNNWSYYGYGYAEINAFAGSTHTVTLQISDRVLAHTTWAGRLADGVARELPEGGTTGQLVERTADGYRWVDGVADAATGYSFYAQPILSAPADDSNITIPTAGKTYKLLDAEEITGAIQAGVPFITHWHGSIDVRSSTQNINFLAVTLKTTHVFNGKTLVHERTETVGIRRNTNTVFSLDHFDSYSMVAVGEYTQGDGTKVNITEEDLAGPTTLTYEMTLVIQRGSGAALAAASTDVHWQTPQTASFQHGRVEYAALQRQIDESIANIEKIENHHLIWSESATTATWNNPGRILTADAADAIYQGLLTAPYWKRLEVEIEYSAGNPALYEYALGTIATVRGGGGGKVNNPVRLHGISFMGALLDIQINLVRGGQIRADNSHMKISGVTWAQGSEVFKIKLYGVR